MRRRRNSCLEPSAADYGPASPERFDDASSFPIHQMSSPTHHCYKAPVCDECNKLELVALQDVGSQFYGAVWHRSGTQIVYLFQYSLKFLTRPPLSGGGGSREGDEGMHPPTSTIAIFCT